LKSARRFVIACAALFIAAQCLAVAAPVVRVKARLTAFDGQVMRLEPLPSSPTTPVTVGKGHVADNKAAQADNPDKPFTVTVLPDTRYVASDRSSFAAIRPGDYAGAAVIESDGKLLAQDVYLYAQALRGTGEGRFAEGGRLIVNGTVSGVKPPQDKQDGNLTLHYRGALLTGLGQGRTLCEGRASPPAYASALACEGSAAITVSPGIPVSMLTVGDKSLLVPGSLVTVAMIKTNDDKNITPGVIVEKQATVAKPQPAP
jgi:hypothetical protein